MSIENFVAKFAEQFEETDSSSIKADTVFKKLEEWSSLIGLSVIAMVDEDYDISIDGNDIRNSITVEDLYEIIQSKL